MPKRKRCSSCRELKDDVKRMEDPYIRELENKTVMVNLCVNCARERADDV